MRTAREEAHAYLKWAANILHCSGSRDGWHNEACDRLTAAIEARDTEHANERLAVKLKAARLTGALDVARTALARVGDAPDGECYESGGIARAALAAITKALSETP